MQHVLQVATKRSYPRGINIDVFPLLTATLLELRPGGARVVLADDFVTTPEKQSRINKANELFKNGKKKELLKSSASEKLK